MSVRVITWGGIVTSLCVPDRHGRIGDVVLGFDSLPPYLAPHPCFGAIIGRIAGRVAGGRLNIDGVDWQLPLNDGTNHLHGGFTGFDKRLWRSEVRGETVRLHDRSPDGDEGYPGNLDITVSYTLTEANELVIETEATSDRATPLSMTHHSYFNLAGHGTIEDHWIQVFADRAFERDETLATTGATFALEGTAGDFREPARLGDAIPDLFQHHGDFYPIPRSGGDAPVPVARVTHPASGRALEVRSTCPCMQLYTASGFDKPIVGKAGIVYPRFGGLCLECEGYPGGLNIPDFGDILVRPCRPQRHTTVLAFTTFQESGSP